MLARPLLIGWAFPQDPMQLPSRPHPPLADDPRPWTGTSPLLDLDDPKLRLRAQSGTQLCRTEREKVLALYASVKRIPFAKPFRMRLHTAREVLQQGHGDSADKATLLVALLRAAGVPARMRYLTLAPEALRGFVHNALEPTRPLLEVWLEGRWVRTDTYVLDAPLAAAARQRLLDNGWSHGYGLHVDGQLLWDGCRDAFLNGAPPESDPLVLRDHGVFCDPLEFVSSASYRQVHSRAARLMHWNVASPGMERAIRDLRRQARAPLGPPAAGPRSPEMAAPQPPVRDAGAGSPEPGRAAPVPPRVLGLFARQLPRLQDLAGALEEQVAATQAADLHATLQTHAHAISALRFDLLVAPGLRAGPLERDLASFRAQVLAVSESTAAPWSAARRHLEMTAGARARAATLGAEFTMEFRGLMRRVAEESQSTATLQQHLEARLAPGVVPRGPMQDLLARNQRVRAALQALERLGESGRPAQRAAYQAMEAHSSLHLALRTLAGRLRGGLLERLRVLVATQGGWSAGELQDARKARDDLQQALAAATAAVDLLHACSQELLDWLAQVRKEASRCARLL